MLTNFLLFIPIVAALPDVAFIIISQKAEYDAGIALNLEKSIKEQYENENKQPNIWTLKGEEGAQWGYWGVTPIINQINDKFPSVKWILFLNTHSKVNVYKLDDFLMSQYPSEEVFFGYDVDDKQPTIIHHYFGFEDEKKPFFFPDFSCGVLMSKKLLERVSKSLNDGDSAINQFTIDPGHELAKLIYVMNEDITVTGANKTFCPEDGPDCAVYFNESNYECASDLNEKDIMAYVKTFSGYHESRLPTIQSTWGKDFSSIEYVSDLESKEHKTVSVGVENTNKGHCEKTFEIMKRFLFLENRTFKWLLIADDDTILSVDRLVKMLRCYDPSQLMIIGERYGFGFRFDGYSGYDYPTGGSGMIFSRSAVEKLMSECRCPGPSSPDDMVIGMCSRAYHIPVIHSPALHQAQFKDYPDVYLRRLKPISFHKYTNVDPLWVYKHYLSDDEPHEEL